MTIDHDPRWLRPGLTNVCLTVGVLKKVRARHMHAILYIAKKTANSASCNLVPPNQFSFGLKPIHNCSIELRNMKAYVKDYREHQGMAGMLFPLNCCIAHWKSWKSSHCHDSL
ncbi:hypothetical protein HOLleu_03645 [Holothuria leucospilota]|uniref:Uncharacterized protein n=1 Tax=Holothuria leucospilota TaxID=206669 RepID=A0A9Q1CTP3_HOLLE|nr:hypothetical protein HOLleu_03645 [Holothuria leucospilota]